MESLTHLLRGNIGSGLMAMGDAFKNAGLLIGCTMTLFLGIVCVHNQHVLVCARNNTNNTNINKNHSPTPSEHNAH